MPTSRPDSATKPPDSSRPHGEPVDPRGRVADFVCNRPPFRSLAVNSAIPKRPLARPRRRRQPAPFRSFRGRLRTSCKQPLPLPTTSTIGEAQRFTRDPSSGRREGVTAQGAPFALQSRCQRLSALPEMENQAEDYFGLAENAEAAARLLPRSQRFTRIATPLTGIDATATVQSRQYPCRAQELGIIRSSVRNPIAALGQSWPD